jgi:hypothetical protein
MVIDDRIIRAARCDLNERFFVSRDVERSAKSGTGSRSWTAGAVKRQPSIVRQF